MMVINILGKAAVMISFAGLVGCVSEAPAPKPVDRFETDKVAFAQSSNLLLCQADEQLKVVLSENSSVSSEARDRRVRYQLLQKEIDLRHVDCYKIRTANAPQAKGFSPKEKKHRATLICRATAERSRYADPSTLFKMCATGFNSTAQKCRNNLAKFSHEINTIPIGGRAEFTEISSAFRQGCNLR